MAPARSFFAPAKKSDGLARSFFAPAKKSDGPARSFFAPAKKSDGPARSFFAGRRFWRKTTRRVSCARHSPCTGALPSAYHEETRSPSRRRPRTLARRAIAREERHVPQDIPLPLPPPLRRGLQRDPPRRPHRPHRKRDHRVRGREHGRRRRRLPVPGHRRLGAGEGVGPRLRHRAGERRDRQPRHHLRRQLVGHQGRGHGARRLPVLPRVRQSGRAGEPPPLQDRHAGGRQSPRRSPTSRRSTGRPARRSSPTSRRGSRPSSKRPGERR